MREGEGRKERGKRGNGGGEKIRGVAFRKRKKKKERKKERREKGRRKRRKRGRKGEGKRRGKIWEREK
ncbi:hypothetical protein G4O25_28505, partial [Escherichia coli]|uniref:hypothetical protein n=1 Tax=Escherichia coli TaxID=562 RepID=UPI0015C85ECF